MPYSEFTESSDRIQAGFRKRCKSGHFVAQESNWRVTFDSDTLPRTNIGLQAVNDSRKTVFPGSSVAVGQEWLVDAMGCLPAPLSDLDAMRDMLDALIADLGLTPLTPGIWHRFPEPGGITGMYLLAESHLTCHTWPEHGTATINLFCCKPRPIRDWETRLKESLGATQVVVRCMTRGEGRS